MATGFEPPELSVYLFRKKHTLGVKLINVLRNKPGQTFTPMELLTLAKNQPDNMLTLRNLQSAPWIPLCDQRAIQEYRKRIKEILAQEDRNPKVQTELDMLFKELRRVEKPGGIKSDALDARKAYDNVYQAIKRVIKLAPSPESRDYLKQHIKSGASFSWSL
jgi:hypothetical protein